MIKRLVAIVAVLSLCATVANAAYHLRGVPKGVTAQVIEDSGVVSVQDVSGTDSWDLEFDSSNDTGSFAVGGPVWTGLGWDVVLQTSGNGSWASEAVWKFDNDADMSSPDLFLTVGVGVGEPVDDGMPFSSDGILKFADIEGLDDIPLPTGTIYYEVFESFDDVADEVDATFTDGSLSFQVVPEPAAMGLMLMAGLSGLLLRRRS